MSKNPPALEAEGELAARIRQKLEAQLEPTELHIENESALHVGHVGTEGAPFPTETHFSIHAKANAFKTKTPLQRHQLVHQILKDEIKLIHAIQFNLTAPKD